MKKLISIIRLLLIVLVWPALVYLAYTIVQFKTLGKVPENVFSKEGIIYSAIFTGILLLISTIRVIAKVVYPEDLIGIAEDIKSEPKNWNTLKYALSFLGFDEEMLLRIAYTGLLFTILLLGYMVLPFFHERQTIVVTQDVARKVNTAIYVEENDSIEMPIKTKGKELALISTSSKTEDFMLDFCKENEPFFARKDLTVLLLSNGELKPFYSKDFKDITYSGENTNIIEVLKELDYETIWLFSADMSEVTQFGGDKDDKTIIVYSSEFVDVMNLKTHFTEVVAIEIRTLK